MRTVTFKSILWGVARNLGLKPSENLSPDQAETLTDYINREIRTAWGEFDWPELRPVQERYFRPVWEEAVYDADEEVYHADTDAYYRATVEVMGTEVPGTSSDWEEITDFEKYVEYAQEGQDTIAEVIAIWSGNPRTRAASLLVPYWLSDQGIQFNAADVGNSVWLEFRLPQSVFTAETYDAGATYVPPETVYFPDTGECYQAIEATIGDDPSLSEDKWTRIQFPEMLAGYVIEAATALGLSEDGQAAAARSRRNDAELLLKREMARIAITQGQRVTYGAARQRATNQVTE